MKNQNTCAWHCPCCTPPCLRRATSGSEMGNADYLIGKLRSIEVDIKHASTKRECETWLKVMDRTLDKLSDAIFRIWKGGAE